MDRLALQVVLRIQTTVGAGDRLRRLVGFEAGVEILLALLGRRVAQSPVAEHQIVVRRQVLRVDLQALLELGDRLVVLPFQEQEAADLVAHHLVARVLRGGGAQVLQRFVVAPARLQGKCQEVVTAGDLRIDRQRLLQHRQGGVVVSLLHQDTAQVDEAGGIVRIENGHLLEGRFRGDEVSLQEHADAVIVEALAIERLRLRRGGAQVVLTGRSARPAFGQLHDQPILGHHGDGKVRDLLHRAGYLRRVAGEHELPVVGVGRRGVPLRGRVAHPGVRELRVPPREFPVVHARREGERSPRVGRYGDPEARHVSGAGRYEVGVDHGPRRPGIALVDRVAVGIHQERSVAVRPRLDRAAAAILDVAAPVEDATGGVFPLELEPDIEGIDRAAREEMPDGAGARHDVDAVAPARPHEARGTIQRRHHGRRRSRAAGRAARRDAAGASHRLGDLGDEGRRAWGVGLGRGRRGFGLAGLFRRRAFAAVGGGEDVEGQDAGAQEVLRRLQLHVVVVGEWHRGVGGRESVRVDEAVDVGGIGRFHQRHVAVGAVLRLRRIVEGPRPLPRHAAPLPGIVFVEAAEPAVMVHRHVEMHLVAGGAELGARLAMERLQHRRLVRPRIKPDHVVVHGMQHRVPAGDQAVHLGVLEDVPPLPHRVLDVHDRMADETADAGLRLRRVDLAHDRGVHPAGQQHRLIVAAAAPLGRLRPDHLLHVLDRLAVPLVVERRHMVHRGVPLRGDVGVASLIAARLRLEKEILRHQAAAHRRDR